MTDDFVLKAFADADRASADDEFEAYRKNIWDDDADTAHTIAALRVGVSRVMELMKASEASGMADILVEYTENLLLVGFHMGYRAAKENK